MEDFYVIVSADAVTPGEFDVPVSWLSPLRDEWECALIEVSAHCDPDKKRLYVCSDMVDRKYVISGFSDAILRNIDTRGESVVRRSFLDPRYIPLRHGWKQYARFRCLDDRGTTVQSTHLYGVLHVRQRR